jgi:hypothetical protein
MKVFESEVLVPGWLKNGSPLAGLQKAVAEACGKKAAPIRVAMVGKNRLGHVCEMEALGGLTNPKSLLPSGVFDYRQRTTERTSSFNAVMLIPTGVDCAIGGHAGDATPAARLLASQCDHLVLHPNVVNASDINEQADNCLYVEGSLICRLMMGTIGLQKVRQNRVLLVTEERPEAPHIVDNTINCAEGARATLGMDIQDVVVLEEGLEMKTGVAANGAVHAGGDQHHRVERAGPLGLSLAIVEHARRQQRFRVRQAAESFHLADVAEPILADHGHANRGGLLAAGLGDGLLQPGQRRAVLQPARDENF